MKTFFCILIALITAALPPAASAAEAIGPEASEAGRPAPLPSVPALPPLPLGLDGIPTAAIPETVVPEPVSGVPDLASRPAAAARVEQAQASASANAAQAFAAKAQAQAALPQTAADSRDAAQVRARAEQVFSGARAAQGDGLDLSAGGDAPAVSAGADEAPSSADLERPTGRGPPSRREPPSGENGDGGNDGRGGSSRKVLAAVAFGAVVAALAFSPARLAATQTLGSQAHVVLSDFARHGTAFGVVSALSTIGYDFSNIVGFLYPLTQVHALFKARSGKISLAQQLTGMGASLLLAFNMFYLNRPEASTLFSAYQNLFGGLTFAAIIGQVFYYDRRPAADGKTPSAMKVLAQTGVVIGALTALTTTIGAALTAWLPMLHAGSMIVPFQMVLGFGFAYLTLPAYLKIEREKSVGAASFGTTAMFFAANASLVVWALYRIATLPGAAAASALVAGAAFAAAAAVGSFFAFHWLAKRTWDFIPENLKILGRSLSKASVVDAAVFVVVAVFMTAIVAAGYLGLKGVVGAPGQQRELLTFLFYLVDVILASTNAALTMHAFRKYRKSAGR